MKRCIIPMSEFFFPVCKHNKLIETFFVIVLVSTTSHMLWE
jgi:putative SOS response-associated peptidase YedK